MVTTVTSYLRTHPVYGLSTIGGDEDDSPRTEGRAVEVPYRWGENGLGKSSSDYVRLSGQGSLDVRYDPDSDGDDRPGPLSYL